MKKILIPLILFALTLSFPLKAQRYGKDSVACITNLSLYIEDYKIYKEGTGSEESVQNMIRAWNWVFRNCPAATENIYVDGAVILDLMMDRTKDEQLKARLVDTLMQMYDQRIQYFGKEGFVLGRKGVDLFNKAPERYAEAYPALKRSVELEGNASSAAVLVYYFRAAAKMVQTKEIEKIELVDAYDRVTTIIDNNLKNPAKTSAYENAQKNVEMMFEPYASCPDLISIYEEKFRNGQDDANLMRKIIGILEKKSCTDQDLYMNATIRLNELEPSPESSFLIGKMYIRKGNQSKAIEYLEKGTEMEKPEDRADCYLLLANAHFQLRNYRQAREAALQAASLRPSDGRPWLLIGDMYATTAAECGDNPVSSRAAYWVAVDKYIKARSVDPGLEKEASEKISTYSRYYPANQDLFFRELKEGDSYTVGCWINETTTVRALK
jgi:hypothetical protein